MAFSTVKDKTLANIVWSDVAEYRLSEFVDQFTLPQVVKVLEGYHGIHEDSCISIDQVLMLHSVKTTEKALVRDRQNTELCIPLNCKQTVELCPYTGTAPRLSSFKFVRVTQEFLPRNYSGERIPVCRGDKLEVVRVKRDAKGKADYIVFQNLDRRESFRLPLSATAGFQPLLNGREHYLKEASLMELPAYFQFIDPPTPVDVSVAENVFNSSLGVLKLEQVYQDSSVICTTKEGNMRTVVTCPKTLPIMVAVAQGALMGDKDYVRLCKVFHEGVSLSKIENMESENIYASPDSVREYQYIDVAPPVHPRTKPLCKEAKKTASSQEAVKPGMLSMGSPDSAAKELRDERQHSVENIYEDPEALIGRGKLPLVPPTSPTSKPDPKVVEEVADSNILGQMSVKEVSNFLKSWRLGDFMDVFTDNDVDGEILVSMNAQEMNDLGMNSFQSKKLLMLISGWRPKTDSS